MEKVARWVRVQAGTLSGSPVAVAAGLASLRLTREPGFYGHARCPHHRNWVDGLVTAARRHSLSFSAQSLGPGCSRPLLLRQCPDSFASVAKSNLTGPSTASFTRCAKAGHYFAIRVRSRLCVGGAQRRGYCADRGRSRRGVCGHAGVIPRGRAGAGELGSRRVRAAWRHEQGSGPARRSSTPPWTLPANGVSRGLVDRTCFERVGMSKSGLFAPFPALARTADRGNRQRRGNACRVGFKPAMAAPFGWPAPRAPRTGCRGWTAAACREAVRCRPQPTSSMSTGPVRDAVVAHFRRRTWGAPCGSPSTVAKLRADTDVGLLVFRLLGIVLAFYHRRDLMSPTMPARIPVPPYWLRACPRMQPWRQGWQGLIETDRGWGQETGAGGWIGQAAMFAARRICSVGGCAPGRPAAGGRLRAPGDPARGRWLARLAPSASATPAARTDVWTWGAPYARFAPVVVTT